MSRLSKISYENQKRAQTGLPGAVDKVKGFVSDMDKSSRLARNSAPKKRKPTSTQAKKNIRSRLILVGAILLLVAAFLYLPQFILKEKTASIPKDLVDSQSINLAANTLKQNPKADFDGDGLDNATEESKKTDPYSDDTDRDGVSDYAEIYSTKTDPTVFEYTLREKAIRDAKNNDTTLSSAYRIGNVILWADDYDSKAYGSVTETLHGYQFCGFKGYAQFGKNEKVYAYDVTSLGHTLLPYRSEEKAWQIDNNNVMLSDKKLETAVCLNLFSFRTYMPENFATRILATILPDKGFVTAYPCLRMDAEPELDKAVIADIQKPKIDKTDTKRLQKNTITLKDLGYVRSNIDAGGCVAVSLMNDSVGEMIALIYGYSDAGLYVADISTGEHLGVITVHEMARMFMDKSGIVTSKEYFSFDGFGFNSGNGSRINFFSFLKKDGKAKKQETEEDGPKSTKTEKETKEEETTKKEEETTKKEEPTTEAPTQASVQPETPAYQEPIYYPEPYYPEPYYPTPVTPEPAPPAPTVPGNDGVDIIG